MSPRVIHVHSYASGVPTPKPSAGAAWLLMLILGVAPGARAATLYWDGDGTGVVGGGTGTWDTSLTRWSTTSNGSTYQAWSNSAAPPDDAWLANTAGTLTLGEDITLRSLTARTTGYVLNGFTLNLSGGTGIIDVGTAAATTLTINSLLGGSTGLTKQGAGILTLNAANTFTGGTTLSAGTINLGNDNALSSGTLTLAGGTLAASGAARTLTNAVTLSATSTISGTLALTLSGPVTLNGNRNLNVSNTALTTLSGGLVETGGARNFTKSGNGNLLLTAASSYTGTTTVSAGALLLGPSGTISAANLVLNGGILAQGTDFTRGLGTGAGQVAFAATGSGGFAAYGGPVSITGFTGTPVWGLTPNFLANTRALILGGALADNVVTWTNDFSLGTAARTITANDNTLSTTDRAVISGLISSGAGGALTRNGAGRLDLTAANTYTGPTLLQGGITGITTLGNVSAGASSLGAPATIADGTLGMGSTTTAATLLYLGNGSSTDRVLNLAGTTGGATLQNDGTGPLVFSSGVTATGAGSKILTLTGNNTGANAIQGVIANNSGTNRTGLTKSGTGNWTLSGANTYSGNTTVSAGTLSAGTDTAFGTGTLVLAGGTVAASGGARTLANVVSHTTSSTLGGTENLTFTGAYTQSTGSRTLTVNNSANTTFSGPAFTLAENNQTRTLTLAVNGGPVAITGVVQNGTGTGADGLTKSGNGTLELSGANTFNGALTVSAGTLRASGGAASLGAGTLAVGTATLDLRADAATTYGRNTTVSGTATFAPGRATSGAGLTHTLGTLSIGTATLALNPGANVSSGTSDLVFGATTLTGNPTFNPAANTRLTLGPVAGGASARAITKNGAGELVLSGAGTFTTASSLTVNNGTARLGASNALGATSLVNVTVRSNVAGTTALLDLAGFDQAILALTFGGTGGTATSTSNLSTGAGLLTLGGTVTFTNTGNPLGSTLSGRVSLGSANRTFSIADSTTAAADLTVSALVSGAAGAGLTKTGTGTLVLAHAANTYTGPTLLQGGVTSVATLANLGAPSSLGAPATVGNGTLGLGATTTAATLRHTGAASSTDRVVNLAGTTGGAVLDASGTGALEFTAAAFTATGAGSKLLTLTGNNTGANRIASAIVNNSATNLTSLTKAGTGSWELNGLSTYTGATSIQAGTLTVSSLANLSTASALGAPTSVANGTVALGSTTNTGTLVYTGGTTSTNRVINLAGTTGGAVLDASGTGPLTFTSAFTATGAGSKLLTLTGNNTGANTIAGAIVNNSATNLTRVAKTGDGTWVLSGANSFTGNLTVSAGTLRLGANGVLPDTAPVILAGGTLDVSGRTETAGTLTLTAPATIDFGASAAAIVFAASNGLTWSGATLTISNYSTGVDSLRFGANASALTATQLGKFRFADYGNVSGQIDAFGVVTPVPEPSAFAALAGLAALGGALWQRRRRSLTVPQHHQTS